MKLHYFLFDAMICAKGKFVNGDMTVLMFSTDTTS